MATDLTLADRFERLVPIFRSQFPQIGTLKNGARRIYLDNAAGTLVPERVAAAMAEGALWWNPQPERNWPGAHETSEGHQRVRSLLAEFLNSSENDRIYLCESTTSALYKLREALEPDWGASRNVVVTDCDHFANISPWEWRANWEVRRARMTADGSVDLDQLAGLLNENTAVVAVTMAGNGLGTILPLDRVRALVTERAPRAMLVVDGVHAAPHLPIDVARLGADALAFSTYKLFGPPCGVLWLSEAVSRKISPYHVAPHRDAETWMEWGTLDNAMVSGIGAALEYVQSMGERLEPVFVGQYAEYPRSRRLFKLALAGAREYEAGLSRRVLDGLAAIEGAEVHGITDPCRISERVPTFGFDLRAQDGSLMENLEPRFWKQQGVQIAVGSHYSAAVIRALERSQMARASFSHYNTYEEVEFFLSAARNVAADGRGGL